MDEVTMVRIVLSAALFIIPMITYLATEAVFKRIYKIKKFKALFG